MVVSVDGAVDAVADEGAEVMREAVGIDAFALDQAGVAEGGLLGGAAPVEQHHRAASLLQVQRYADADDAGAGDGDVGAKRRRIHPCLCPPPTPRSPPCSAGSRSPPP